MNPYPDDKGRTGEPAPHDAEMSRCVRAHGERHEAPERLVDHFHRLAETEGRESRRQVRRIWQASFVGAMAASLTLMTGIWAVDRLWDTKDPYDVVAQEAKNFKTADFFPQAVQDRIAARQKARLDQLFSSFNKDFRYQQKIAISGQEEFVLEGATLREVEGMKVAHVIYRTGNTHLHLTVAPAEENAEWPDVLRREGWVVLNPASPRTYMWRKGAFIYALVGDLPLERFKEFSAAVSSGR
ncbi:MAG: hypothetical protein AABZ64_07685 [Nitrospinota bacterium]